MRRTQPAIDRVWTVLDVIDWGKEYFTRKDVDSPRLTIELMICHVLGIGRIKLYTDHERPLSPTELAQLRSMIERRVRQEPLQYILGEAPFYGCMFEVTADVLIPRPETELLVERIVRHGKGQNGLRGLDIGTGSGCIAIAAAVHLPQSTWLALDVSPAAADLARRNAERNGVADRVKVEVMDILRELPDEKFDVLAMNPPYIPSADVPELEAVVRDYEPHIALTDDADGLTFYRRLATVATDVLAEGGVMFWEIGFGQKDTIIDIAMANRLTIEIVDDLSGIPRIAIVGNSVVTMS